MIPILYESYETEFESNGLGRLRDCLECKVTEERNGLYECDFTYPITGAGYDKIKLGRIIAVRHDDTDDVQPFDIVSYSRPIDGKVTFHAVHISYRQSGITVTGNNVNSLADAFDLIKNAQPINPFTYETDIPGSGYVASLNGTPRSVRSVLGGVEGSILDTFGGEYEWDKWTVRLWRSRGVDRDFSVRYGVNMTDYGEDVDYSQSYTSVIPFWSGTAQNGAPVVVVGNLIDTNEKLYDTRTVCVPLDLTDKFEGQPTQTQVEEMAVSYLNSVQPYIPQQSIRVDFIRLSDQADYANFADLETCRLCDRIRVFFPDYGAEGRFKIVRTEYDVLLERFTSMELGALSTTLSEALGITQGADGKSSAPLEQDDVVKETGVKGVWNYRKWANGRIEAWTAQSFDSATPTVWASPVRYMDKSITIPAGIFSSAPNIIATSPSTQYWVVGATASSATSISLRLATVASSAMATAVKIYAYTN